MPEELDEGDIQASIQENEDSGKADLDRAGRSTPLLELIIVDKSRPIFMI